MPKTLSIVVPYLSGSGCVDRCRELIKQNTAASHEFVEVVDCPNVYRAYREGAAKARGKILVMLNDDMFVAPGWDEHVVPGCTEKTIVTTYLVESGRHAVNHRNIERNFGQTVETFDRPAFEDFAAAQGPSVPESRPGLGWYMPMAVRREDFIPYPREDPKIPCDILLFGVFASRHYRFAQVRSFAYHLQRMSDPQER